MRFLNQQVDRVRGYVPPRGIKAIEGFDCTNYQQLSSIGIDINDASVYRLMRAAKDAMDALQPTITTASIGTPIQFLQTFLPGLVKIITQARKIDELVGISMVGTWEQAMIVQGELELTGSAVPYGDYTNVPFSSWNENWVYRNIVRFEEGVRVGILEEKRAAAMNVSSSASKREAASLALEINRNSIGFNGYNSGINNTYGFLNDPNLPNYVNFATGASSSTLWSTKTFLEIVADIRTMVATLRNQSGDTIDPETTNLTLGLATSVVDYLSTVSDLGESVRDWMTKNYPRIRVVSAPELNAANGGANAAYLYADVVNDLSTDGGQTFIQMVPTKFMLTGVEQKAKAYIEDYTNATAGVMVKRQYAVRRYSGN